MKIVALAEARADFHFELVAQSCLVHPSGEPAKPAHLIDGIASDAVGDLTGS